MANKFKNLGYLGFGLWLGLSFFVTAKAMTLAEQIDDAIFWGHTSRLKNLLKNPEANVAANGAGWLGRAVFFSQTNAAKAIIEAGVGIETPLSFGETALMAAMKGNPISMSMVRMLVAKGANVNAINTSYGRDVLGYAVESGNQTAIDFLLSHGAIIRSPICAGGSNAFMAAAASGNLRFLQRFSEQLHDYINSRGANQLTALMLAAKEGNWATYKYLIDQGADWSLTDAEGNSLLMFAASAGNKRIVEDLIARGADVNQTNNNGETAMVKALFRSKRSVFGPLMRSGANLKIVYQPFNKTAFDDVLGITGSRNFEELIKYMPQDLINESMQRITTDYFQLDRHYKIAIKKMPLTGEKQGLLVNAAGRYGDIETLTKLKRNGADLDAVEPQTGNDALLFAAKQGQLGTVKWLLRNGKRFDHRNRQGHNAVQLAMEGNRPNVVTELIRSGMNVDAPDMNGDTYLLSAIARGNESMVQTLVGLGADTRIPGARGITPVMAAIEGKHYNLSRKMIESVTRADLNHRDHTGRTVLSIAISSRNYDGIRLLLSHCAAVTDVGPARLSVRQFIQGELLVDSERQRILDILDSNTNLPHCQKPKKS